MNLLRSAFNFLISIFLRHSFFQGDFCNAPFPDESFQKIFAIEATCHAQSLAQVYGEAYRMLKPGGLFGFYEWIVTEKYDPNNTFHRQIKHGILVSQGKYRCGQAGKLHA